MRHRTTPGSVEAVLARRHNWPGARELRRVLWGEEPVSLSKLEASFIARLRDAGLPLPETNSLVDGRRIDRRWPENRLTVELDGYRHHHTRHAWEQDRRRAEARGRGDEFRRYTYSDVIEDPGLDAGRPALTARTRPRLSALDQLLEAAVPRVLVVPPADDLRAVANPAAAGVVVGHLDDQLGRSSNHSSSRFASQRLGSPLPFSPVS